MLGLGRGSWAVSQKHTSIRKFQGAIKSTIPLLFYLHEMVKEITGIFGVT